MDSKLMFEFLDNEDSIFDKYVMRLAELDAEPETPAAVEQPPKSLTVGQRRARLLAALDAEAGRDGRALLHRVKQRSGLADDDWKLALAEAELMRRVARWQGVYLLRLK